MRIRSPRCRYLLKGMFSQLREVFSRFLVPLVIDYLFVVMYSLSKPTLVCVLGIGEEPLFLFFREAFMVRARSTVPLEISQLHCRPWKGYISSFLILGGYTCEWFAFCCPFCRYSGWLIQSHGSFLRCRQPLCVCGVVRFVRRRRSDPSVVTG
ncbi:hypothetical protein M413DRAFT_239265 [Hebeloma cylindrosporum]|uniref:Uncharacterized protein n=1 Tax=Hebeloma cylindrosporum TaxID=76867 RepID=A0A0C2YD10_HEBCY|nr:hypothetical protein M413DRAFT_239265 [Hebeloma cylindrosporum h7]